MVAPQEMTLSSTAPLVRGNRDTCHDHLDLSVWGTPAQDYLLAIRGGPKAVFGDGGHLVRLCLTEDTPGTEAFSGRETGKGRIAVAGLVVYSNPPNTDLNNHTRSKHCYFATNRILYKEQSLHATQSRFFYFESRARLWYSSLPFSCNTWQLWGGPVYPLTLSRLTPWDHHCSEPPCQRLVSVVRLTYLSFDI